MRVLPTPGHTAGHQSVLIGQPGGPRALFLGDVVPTAVHVRLPWVMAYDLEPARTLETKRSLFARAVAEDWLVIWGHDPDHQAGRLAVDKDGAFVVRELVTIRRLQNSSASHSAVWPPLSRWRVGSRRNRR